MPPHTKRENEELENIIKKTSESTAQLTAETVKKSIMDEIGTKGSKISEMLNKTKPVISDEEKEKLEKEKKAQEHNHEDIFCPNCTKDKEHAHVLKDAGQGKVKCTGDNCGTIYNLIPDNAGYKCTGCGLPHAKPAVVTPDDKCPFCNSEEFNQFDWSKIKKLKKK